MRSSFFFTNPAPTEIYTLSLHDALPICQAPHTHKCYNRPWRFPRPVPAPSGHVPGRSEEHTSELQSQSNLVCRLLLEKKKQIGTHGHTAAKSSTTNATRALCCVSRRCLL